MGEERTLIVGYDLGNEFTQISCLSKKLTEPESVSITPDAAGYMIPTVLSVKESTREWLFGEEAVRCSERKAGIYVDNLVKKLENKEDTLIDDVDVAPELLLEKFFVRTLAALRQKYLNQSIAQMVVTTKDLNNEMRERLYGILKKLGLESDRLKIISYTECFMYYALSQKAELWTNDVGLFDLGETGLRFYQLSIGRRGNPAPVIASTFDLSREFPYSQLNEDDNEKISGYFEQLTAKFLHRRVISTLYFTGSGFDMEWAGDTLRRLCMGRRVFKGQNLYTKGACYAAKNIKEDEFKEFFFLSEDRITSTISMKVHKEGNEGSVIFAKAGDYYADVDEEVRIILDDENTLDFGIHNLIKKDDVHAFLTLNGLPKRKNKTIQLSVSLRFSGRETAVVTVKDLGLGSFYKTSYRIWEFRLEI